MNEQQLLRMAKRRLAFLAPLRWSPPPVDAPGEEVLHEPRPADPWLACHQHELGSSPLHGPPQAC